MEKLIVSGDINLQQLTGLYISASVNEHAHAMFSGIMPEEEAPEILNKKVESVTLHHENETEKSVLFSGKISKYTIRKERGIANIEVECISASVEFDKQKNCRSFQDTRMTYGQIFRQMAGDNQVILPIAGADKKIPYPLFQYNETDWEFLKRLAVQLNTVVVPNHCHKNPQVAIGSFHGKTYESLDMNRLEIQNDFHAAGNMLSLEIPGKPDMNLCDKVLYNNTQFTVLKKKVGLSNGMLEYSYRIGNGFEQTDGTSYNANLCGLRLSGRVMETSGIQLKLRLDIDRQNKEQELYPYNYLPVTGNGMYAMPEIGSTAYLYFPDSNEGNAFAVDCLPTEKTEEEDSDSRYLKTADEKELDMFSSELILKSGGNIMRISDESNVGFLSGSQIRICSEGEILFTAGGLSRLHADKSIHMEHKSRTRDHIHMEGVECTVKTSRFRTSDLGSKVERLSQSNPMTAWRSGEIAKNMAPKVMGAIPASTAEGIGGKVLGGIPGYENGSMNLDFKKAAGVRIEED